MIFLRFCDEILWYIQKVFCHLVKQLFPFQTSKTNELPGTPEDKYNYFEKLFALNLKLNWNEKEIGEPGSKKV